VRKGEVVPVDELYVTRPQAPKTNPKDNDKNKDKNAEKKYAKQPAGPTAKLLGGDVINLLDHNDPRVPLMAWLRDPNNKFFARAFVNRVWASYFNVGIVNPADDMSLANAPSNAALLDYLTREFIAHQFDMKWLHREIANSQTYQRSWKPNDTNKLDQKNFSHAIPRRLPAEVALDALKQATASDDDIAKMQASLKGRAIAVPGTTARGGKGGSDGFALTVFGRSTRESNCDCDRSMEPSLLQTVYMQNDDDVSKMLNEGWVRSLSPKGKQPPKSNDAVATGKSGRNFEKLLEINERALKKAKNFKNEKQIKELESRIAELKAKFKKTQEVVEAKADETQKPVAANLEPETLIKAGYLRSLSRLPSDEEMTTAKKYLTQAEDSISGARDLLWALINTKEFVLNH
ncbi:MAG TPA: DUF1553 domain-containing protein, partial [Planctomycetaceae bacterium]|nr:DUF1553 domain-containing protein [Planctomycetaceae bacterium]